jgi:hypothetical protein
MKRGGEGGWRGDGRGEDGGNGGGQDREAWEVGVRRGGGWGLTRHMLSEIHTICLHISREINGEKQVERILTFFPSFQVNLY